MIGRDINVVGYLTSDWGVVNVIILFLMVLLLMKMIIVRSAQNELFLI